MPAARRSRIRRAASATARWVAASIACGALGAVVAGAFEGFGADAFGAIATVGFFSIIAAPILIAASLVLRGFAAAWRPRQLIASLVDEDGSAPRLAAWTAVVWLAIFGLAWAMFQGTWLLAAWTQFKTTTVSFGEPIIAVLAMLVIVTASRPAALVIAWLARKLDARWRRRGRRTLLRPAIIFGVAIVLAFVAVYLVWKLLVLPRIGGTLETSSLHGPALAVATLIAAHVAWQRASKRARRLGGTLATAAAVASIAVAVVATRVRPSTTLEIWGDQPVAGLAIERLFDLEVIRTRVSLAELRPVERPGTPHPDIVLITIDTVRADFTPPYGSQNPMPVLRELGVRGTVFLHAFSPSNVTRRSIPSMVTGLAPNRVRGRVVGWALRVDPRHVLLAERLRAGGYETAGFMCCKGFWGEEARTGLQRGLELVTIEGNGQRLAKAARTWIEQRERDPHRKPLFLWMHILEPHNWSTGVDPKTDDDRRRFYSRILTQTDAMLLDVMQAFALRPPELAPITIVTSDHGTPLGEHGQPVHSTDLYNSQIHVPFVVTGPGIKSQRVAETVSLTDLTPTIVELAGFQPPDGLDGRSVAPLATGARIGDPDAGEAFSAMIKDRSNPGGITSLVKGRWKLVHNASIGYELYDIRSDASERYNLALTNPQMVEQLKPLLTAREEAARISPFP